eukprot:gnl/TRDRNA2_/TRDRNA2_157809_c0_seq1.p1 gnl/TRDRNA2_/TRDRNA2_157809_c0~~gnl/TRDRNA2_/TRDRNA2_157809_c0_seq1.p1  ORF type:complete len:202 (-),score=30.06 gnl/TRDRNA2_/TRDRNA2_157809_c0_seq1:48-629(-)
MSDPMAFTRQVSVNSTVSTASRRSRPSKQSLEDGRSPRSLSPTEADASPRSRNPRLRRGSRASREGSESPVSTGSPEDEEKMKEDEERRFRAQDIPIWGKKSSVSSTAAAGSSTLSPKPSEGDGSPRSPKSTEGERSRKPVKMIKLPKFDSMDDSQEGALSPTVQAGQKRALDLKSRYWATAARNKIAGGIVG